MKLRTQTELTSEALARILSKQTKIIWNKWMNLLFFKPPTIDEQSQNLDGNKRSAESNSENCKFLFPKD